MSNVYSRDIERKKDREYKEILKEEKAEALKHMKHVCPFCHDSSFITNRQLAGHKGWCVKNPNVDSRERRLNMGKIHEKLVKQEEPSLSELLKDVQKYELTPDQLYKYIHKFEE